MENVLLTFAVIVVTALTLGLAVLIQILFVMSVVWVAGKAANHRLPEVARAPAIAELRRIAVSTRKVFRE